MAVHTPKSLRQIRKEFGLKYGPNDVVLFRGCDNYTQPLPKITITFNGIEVLGSHYQISTMQLKDTGIFWNEFWKTVGIDTFNILP